MGYCSQTLAGLARDCESNKGGIQEVLLAAFDAITGVTAANGKVTAITTKTTSAKPFYSYKFNKETGNMTSNLNTDQAAGVSYIQTNVLMQFNRMDTQKRVEIQAIAMSDMVCIVKDCNGKYWYLGKDEPVTASAGDAQTGTARGDANRYTITLTDTSSEFPMEVDADVVDGLRASD